MSAQATIFCRGFPRFPTSARDALTPHAHVLSAPSRELVSHAVTSQMDDRWRESDFRRREANNETPPNVDNLLTSRGQATPSVRAKASSQPK